MFGWFRGYYVVILYNYIVNGVGVFLFLFFWIMIGGWNWDWNLVGWLEYVLFEFFICLSIIIRVCFLIIIYCIIFFICYKIFVVWYFYSNII